MSIESVDQLVPWASLLGNFAIGTWLYLERRNDKTNQRVTALSDRVEKLDKDVVSLTTAAEGAPSHDDLSRLYTKIDDTNERLSETSDRVAKLSGSLESLNDTLRVISSEIIKKGLGHE